jgi:hypothetical protein
VCWTWVPVCPAIRADSAWSSGESVKEFGTTRAPRAAKTSATPRPMPELEPVTTATLPLTGSALPFPFRVIWAQLPLSARTVVPRKKTRGEPSQWREQRQKRRLPKEAL